jgi:hypothetical protein
MKHFQNVRKVEGGPMMLRNIQKTLSNFNKDPIPVFKIYANMKP